jgi:hypothetical protein
MRYVFALAGGCVALPSSILGAKTAQKRARRPTDFAAAHRHRKPQPCIRRPRGIIGTMSSMASAQWSLPLPSRTSMPASRTPQSRLPYSSQALPPNMGFSANLGSISRSSLRSSSRHASRERLLTPALFLFLVIYKQFKTEHNPTSNILKHCQVFLTCDLITTQKY